MHDSCRGTRHVAHSRWRSYVHSTECNGTFIFAYNGTCHDSRNGSSRGMRTDVHRYYAYTYAYNYDGRRTN